MPMIILPDARVFSQPGSKVVGMWSMEGEEQGWAFALLFLSKLLFFYKNEQIAFFKRTQHFFYPKWYDCFLSRSHFFKRVNCSFCKEQWEHFALVALFVKSGESERAKSKRVKSKRAQKQRAIEQKSKEWKSERVNAQPWGAERSPDLTINPSVQSLLHPFYPHLNPSCGQIQMERGDLELLTAKGYWDSHRVITKPEGWGGGL